MVRVFVVWVLACAKMKGASAAEARMKTENIEQLREKRVQVHAKKLLVPPIVIWIQFIKAANSS
jgi:hypothetical protein